MFFVRSPFLFNPQIFTVINVKICSQSNFTEDLILTDKIAPSVRNTAIRLFLQFILYGTVEFFLEHLKSVFAIFFEHVFYFNNVRIILCRFNCRIFFSLSFMFLGIRRLLLRLYYKINDCKR